MNSLVIEHVPVAELPQAWRDQLGQSADARVTVRVEVEGAAQAQAVEFADDPLFGMWRERDDMVDAAAYVRNIRAPRFNADGSRNAS